MTIKKVNTVPNGFRKIEGGLTSPPGYTWYNNGKSRFKPGYEAVLVKNIARSSIQVDIEYYKRQRDVYPRGIGSWAFKLGNGKEVWVVKQNGKVVILPRLPANYTPVMFSVARHKIVNYCSMNNIKRVKVLS